jgi:hypothetical protein
MSPYTATISAPYPGTTNPEHLEAMARRKRKLLKKGKALDDQTGQSLQSLMTPEQKAKFDHDLDKLAHLQIKASQAMADRLSGRVGLGLQVSAPCPAQSTRLPNKQSGLSAKPNKLRSLGHKACYVLVGLLTGLSLTTMAWAAVSHVAIEPDGRPTMVLLMSVLVLFAVIGSLIAALGRD